MTGLLPCPDAERGHRHQAHTWLYVDPATRLATHAVCDGETRPGCPDLLCPCTSRPAGWSTDRAGASMNGGTL